MSSPFTGTYPAGGIPFIGVDIPASAVLLAVYLLLGLIHAFFFFRLSKKTFIPQALVMGFCFSRVVTLALRIAWTNNITNKNIAIAANVFINAGVLLLYIVNLIFLHRFTLQLFPSIPTRGKYPLNLIAHIYMFSIIPLLILVIAPGVQLFLSTDLSTIHTDRIILRFAQVYLTVFVAIQIPLLIIVMAKYILSPKPRNPSSAASTTLATITEGGKLATTESQVGIPASEVTIRALIIFLVAFLLTWIQTVKIIQGFYTPGPTTAINPPWFLRKPILYAGFFLPELLVVIIYAVGGIRKRFLKPVRAEKVVESAQGRVK